jgi:hypothetical protein
MIYKFTNQDLVQFMIFKENMNSYILIQFSEHLEKTEPFYLPSYSTERKYDDYLNCDLKYRLSDKRASKTQERMKENLENQMNMLQKNHHRVTKYPKHESIKYAA